MTTYRVHLPQESIIIIESADTILQAPTIFSRFVGYKWSAFVQFAEQMGLTIEPLLDVGKSDFIIYDDIQYEIRWSQDRTQIKRISKHIDGRVIDISFSQLPQLLRLCL